MAFTVDDFQDLLRLLREHPEWQAELRRQVLSDEVLQLPALVSQLAQRVGALVEAQARTEARLEALAERVTALAEAQARTEAQVGALVGRVGNLEGDMLERRYRRYAPAYFRPLARRLRVLQPEALAGLLEDAVDRGQLTEAELANAILADLVLSGRRREDGVDAYLVVEVSVGIGVDGVSRALERAGILAKLERPALPVVAGNWINPDAAAYAESAGVRTVLDGRTLPSPAESKPPLS